MAVGLRRVLCPSALVTRVDTSNGEVDTEEAPDTALSALQMRRYLVLLMRLPWRAAAPEDRSPLTPPFNQPPRQYIIDVGREMVEGNWHLLWRRAVLSRCWQLHHHLHLFSEEESGNGGGVS